MNTDEARLKHRQLTQTIIGVFYEVYNELGHGFIESVYQNSLVIALFTKGLDGCSPVDIPAGSEELALGGLKAMCWLRNPY